MCNYKAYIEQYVTTRLINLQIDIDKLILSHTETGPILESVTLIFVLQYRRVMNRITLYIQIIVSHITLSQI